MFSVLFYVEYFCSIISILESTEEKEASPTPDDDVFKYLANVYATNHPTMHLGQPCPGSDERFEGGIVNGAMWYQLEGKVLINISILCVLQTSGSKTMIFCIHAIASNITY